MNHHITLQLANSDDFKQLVTLIEDSGFKVLRLDNQTLKLECHIDNFILSLVEKFLDPVVFHHTTPVVKIHKKASHHPGFRNATG